MTEEDLAECRRVIFAIMSLEQKGEALPSPLNQQQQQQQLNTRPGEGPALANLSFVKIQVFQISIH